MCKNDKCPKCGGKLEKSYYSSDMGIPGSIEEFYIIKCIECAFVADEGHAA